MLLRRVIAHFRKQEWTAIGIDFVIVVVGVFIGIQVANWNDERRVAERRAEIVALLVTDLRDSQAVLKNFERDIDEGPANWQAECAAGDLPPPYYMRIRGSDTPPRTWETLQSMDSYIVFVENEILPYENGPRSHFYTADRSALKPEYAASMERARDIARHSGRLAQWNACLIYRLEVRRTFDNTCNRVGYRLEGMPEPEATP